MANIAELHKGNTLKSDLLLDWSFIAPVPPIVAEFWLTKEFPDAIMNSSGVTPSQQPIKNWEIGFGVIVGAMTAFPGGERLVLLHKKGREEFFLLSSTETRETRPIVSDNTLNNRVRKI